MPIIKEGDRARDLLQGIMQEERCLPCFCTESVYTTEAVFRGAKEFKSEHSIPGNLPLIISFTASYEGRRQLKHYTGLSDSREGMLAVIADIRRLSRPDGPYHDLDIMIHLDHAQPGADNWIIAEYSDSICSVMWDCSQYSMKDNISMMKDFVRKNRSSFIIEGAVDEIYNYSPEDERLDVIDHITDPETAGRYFQETGCDLLVANLGTEHRRTEGTVDYHGDVARAIRDRIGQRLVLHGTSSLKEEELAQLRTDGFVKVNLWGNLESNPGKELAEQVIRHVEHMLSYDTVRRLVGEGFLDQQMLNREYKPSMDYLTEKYRRDEIYLPRAVSTVRTFYSSLYQKNQ